MAHLIDKSALVAEIKKLEKMYCYDNMTNSGLVAISVFESINNVIDTLEVKEADLDKEIDNIWNPRFNLGWDEKSLLGMNHVGFKTIAKHFFELGVNASNPLTWKDIDLILDITDQIANDDSMEEKLNNMSQEKYCTEVLKRFKAQKGE